MNLSVPSSLSVIAPLDEPTVIVDVEPPTNLILPSPRLIDFWVEDISKSVASNSNFLDWISTSVPSYFKCLSEPLPT